MSPPKLEVTGEWFVQSVHVRGEPKYFFVTNKQGKKPFDFTTNRSAAERRCAKLNAKTNKQGDMNESKWIRFDEVPTERMITKRWTVNPKEGGAPIGVVGWYGAWRKYCFFPAAQTVFEQTCLRDIAQFCEQATANRGKTI